MKITIKKIISHSENVEVEIEKFTTVPIWTTYGKCEQCAWPLSESKSESCVAVKLNDKDRGVVYMHESCFNSLVLKPEPIKLEECKECPDRKVGYDCDPCTQPGRFPDFSKDPEECVACPDRWECDSSGCTQPDRRGMIVKGRIDDQKAFDDHSKK